MDVKYTGAERRVCKRIRHQFITRFRIYPQKGAKQSHHWNIAIIRNLSAGGLLFNYDKNLVAGTLIEFKITLPFIIRPTHCLGKVCRSEPADKRFGRKLYRVATCFIELDDEKKKVITIHAEKYYSRKKQKSSGSKISK